MKNSLDRLALLAIKYPGIKKYVKEIFLHVQEARKKEIEQNTDTQAEELSISSAAVGAFKSVLLPQLQMLDNPLKVKDRVMELGQGKNNDLENSLISHKPISMNTGDFYDDVKSVYINWVKKNK